MEDRLASALEAAFPDRDVADVTETGPSWNEANRTVRVAFTGGGAAYLKVATDEDGSRVARERAVLAYAAANCGVRVPEVLTSGVDGQVAYLATEPLSGDGLHRQWADASATDRTTMARAVGRTLAAVHARRFEAHGHVVGGGAGGLDLRTGSWTDVLVERITAMRELAPSDRFDHHFDEVIAAVESNRSLLDDAPATLVHGDPARPNCIRGADGIGLVDWELAHVGDPARELYRARDQQFGSHSSGAPDRLVAALHDGYRERAGGLPAGLEARRPIYAAVRFLGTSGFFEQWVDYADEPREAFADGVRTEMDRLLADL